MSVRSILVATALVAGSLVAAAPAVAATPHCTNADLKAGYRHSDDGAGHVWGWIVLRNRSHHACVTGGFGGLSYVGHGDGTQVGAAATRDGHAHVYVLRPGQRLRSPVQETRAANYPRRTCRRTHVDGFRVYVPNATRSQYVPHPTTGCANRHLHLLSHKSYRRP